MACATGNRPSLIPPLILFIIPVAPLFYPNPYESVDHGEGSKEKEYLIKIIDQIIEPGDPYFEMIVPSPFQLIKGD